MLLPGKKWLARQHRHSHECGSGHARDIIAVGDYIRRGNGLPSVKAKEDKRSGLSSYGADEEIRTLGLLFTKQLLYH